MPGGEERFHLVPDGVVPAQEPRGHAGAGKLWSDNGLTLPDAVAEIIVRGEVGPRREAEGPIAALPAGSSRTAVQRWARLMVRRRARTATGSRRSPGTAPRRRPRAGSGRSVISRRRTPNRRPPGSTRLANSRLIRSRPALRRTRDFGKAMRAVAMRRTISSESTFGAIASGVPACGIRQLTGTLSGGVGQDSPSSHQHHRAGRPPSRPCRGCRRCTR